MESDCSYDFEISSPLITKKMGTPGNSVRPERMLCTKNPVGFKYISAFTTATCSAASSRIRSKLLTRQSGGGEPWTGIVAPSGAYRTESMTGTPGSMSRQQPDASQLPSRNLINGKARTGARLVE